MNRLKKKLFSVILMILTICSLLILAAYLLQLFQNEYDRIDMQLKVIESNRKGDYGRMPPADHPPEQDSEQGKGIPGEPEELRELRYIDSKVYTVLLGEDNSIREVISHSNDSVDSDEITRLSEEIIADNITTAGGASAQPVVFIGNLLKDRYSYSYIAGESIVIINNDDTNARIRKMLVTAIAIWAAVELAIVIISFLITGWISRPVQESWNRQKQFVEDASHELKTPLTVIMASEEAYEKSGEQKWLDNIRSESERMSRLVNSLLELAQTEEAVNRDKYERRNLSKIVENAALSMEAILYEHQLELKCELQKDIWVLADEERIKELITILIDNAAEHSDPGATVTVKLNESGQEIILKIINTGEPIPEGEEEKIFERFYRGDKSHNRDTNRYGLGLAIARNIAEAHNGSIRAYSHNRITTMEIRLR